MIELLERRLDAAVYRLKLAPTPFAARQVINHGHIKVNGRRVNIASYQVKVGDLIEIKEASRQLALVVEAQALAERASPERAEELQQARNRLVGKGKGEMGALFKAMAIANRALPAPPGFHPVAARPA